MTDPSEMVDGSDSHLRNIITEQIRSSLVAMLPVYLPPILTNAIKEQFRSIAGIEAILDKHSNAMAQESSELRSSFIAAKTLYRRELVEMTETHLKRFRDQIDELTNINLVVYRNKISEMNENLRQTYLQSLTQENRDNRLIQLEREVQSMRRVNYGLLLIGGGVGAFYLWRNRETWNSKGWIDILSRNGSRVMNKVSSFFKYLNNQKCFVLWLPR